MTLKIWIIGFCTGVGIFSLGLYLGKEYDREIPFIKGSERYEKTSPTVEGIRLGYEDAGLLGVKGPFLYSGRCVYLLPERRPDGCFTGSLKEFDLRNREDRIKLVVGSTAAEGQQENLNNNEIAKLKKLEDLFTLPTTQ